MTSSWDVVRIGSFAEVFDGPHATPKKTTSGPVFLGVSNLSNGSLDLSDTAHLSEADFEKWTRRVTPQPGDVVFSYETRLGEAALIPEGLRCCLGRRMGLLRIDRSKADPRYVLYAYLAPEFQETIRARTIHGSTVDRIPLKELADFPFRLPPLRQQRAIAEVLGVLDDKIELNRQTNQTLEALAQRLFKSWFVDFDPVKAKMAGRAPANMDAETAALFPDRLVESELGKIPEGWATSNIEELVSHVRDSVKVDDIAPDDIYIGLEHIDRKTLWLSNWGIGADVASGKSRFAADDLLFGKLRPYFHKIAIASMNGICSTDILVLRPKAVDYRAFSYVALNQDQLVDFATQTSTGTRMPRANWKTLCTYPIAIPPASIARAFEQQCGVWLEKLAQPTRENQLLAELRDRLLPKLISGQLRVHDAERQIAEVV